MGWTPIRGLSRVQGPIPDGLDIGRRGSDRGHALYPAKVCLFCRTQQPVFVGQNMQTGLGPLQQFTRLQQEVGVAWPAQAAVPDGKGLHQENALRL